MQTNERRSGQDRRTQTSPYSPDRRKNVERRKIHQEVWETAPTISGDNPPRAELPAPKSASVTIPPAEFPNERRSSPSPTRTPPEES